MTKNKKLGYTTIGVGVAFLALARYLSKKWDVNSTVYKNRGAE